jgi:hypothetical protein
MVHAPQEPSGGAAQRPAGPLDQEENNWFRFSRGRRWREELRQGDVVIQPQRGGGAFDQVGVQSRDIARVEDLRALVRHIGGRWVLVTLTIDRSKFLSAQMAEERVRDRVRRIPRSILGHDRGIWFCGFEVQTATGEGWPHWHLALRVPEGLSVAGMKARVLRAWRIKEKIGEDVDRETGEVRERFQFVSIAQPQGVDVSVARCANRVATYVAKYLTKQWEAVPAWMGESFRRFRRMRCSDELYVCLERIHRHDRKKPARRTAHGTRRYRRRSLFDRMAASCTSAVGFVQERGVRQRCIGSVRVPWADAGHLHRFVEEYNLRVVEFGGPHKVRLVCSEQTWRRIVEGPRRSYWSKLTDDFERRKRIEIEAQWDLLQSRDRHT